MLRNNFFINLGKLLAYFIWDIIYFPFWWYSAGLFYIAKILGNFLVNRERALALSVWAKNIGKPMYQQYSWEGRFISFFIRLFQVIFRSIIMLIWLGISLAIFIFWIALPIFVIYQIYYQLS